MNALSSKLFPRATHALRKFSTSNKLHPSFIPKQYQKSFKETWLSDPSTYPIITIISFALTFLVGMSVNAIVTYKDIQIDPRKRNTMVRDWGEGGYQPLTGKLIWWNSWQKNAPEGLGFDHDKWVAAKDEYYKETGIKFVPREH